MKKRVVLAVLALGLALTPLASLGAANPGVVFKIETRDVGSSAPPQVMTASVEGPLLKVDVPAENGGQASAIVYRGDRREIIIINHAERNYMVMDEAAMKQIAAQLNQAMSQMQAMMQNMPAEQRAAMEEMMRGRGMAMMGPPPAAPEIRRTSDTAEHSGFATTKYEVLREGRKERDVWVTAWTALPGANEVKAGFEGLASFMKELTTAISSSGFGPAMSMDTYNQIQELGGYPILTVEYDDNGQPESETRLVSAVEQTVPAADFEAPEGYARQQLPGIGGR